VIADFLNGTVTESLKKLVQPAAVVPATFFVLLNLAFVYPAARGAGVAKSYAGLDKNWQVVVLAAVILALGYLLLNAANGIIDLLAGQSWRQSGLNWLLRKRQCNRRADLQARAKRENRLDPKWELATHFPSMSLDQTIQATRLGNVLVATQQIIWKRYGLDIAAFWAHMEANKELKEAPAMVAVKDEKATLDLLANLIFILALFGVEALIFYSARDRWNAALLSLLAFVAAYVTYRIAVGSARSWGDAMEVVLDLHRAELRKGLGLRETDDLDDERLLWQGARHVFLPGDDQTPPKDLFKAAVKPKLSLTAATSLKVEKVAVTVVDEVVDDPPPAAVAVAGASVIRADLLREVDYLLIASRDADGLRFGGVDLVVDDPRVRRIRVPNAVVVGSVQATPVSCRAGDREQLHWRIEHLPPGDSVTLAYRLPLWRLTISGSAPSPTLNAHAGGVEVAFSGGSGASATFALETFGPLTAVPRLLVNGEEKDMELDRETGVFRAAAHALVGDDLVWLLLPKVAS
jgi:hypothetical protein